MAAKLTEMTGDKRMRDYFKFVYRKPRRRLCAAHVGCLQHLLRLQRRRHVEVGEGLDGHGAGPIRGIRSGKRPTSRSPCGRGPAGIENYRIEPEAIEYGENFIVHREGPEATPYLPNAIMTTNPVCPAG